MQKSWKGKLQFHDFTLFVWFPCVVCNNYSCTFVFVSLSRLFTWVKHSEAANEVQLKLQPSEDVLGDLESAGPQSCILFSDDGTLLASGGVVRFLNVFTENFSG